VRIEDAALDGEHAAVPELPPGRQIRLRTPRTVALFTTVASNRLALGPDGRARLGVEVGDEVELLPWAVADGVDDFREWSEEGEGLAALAPHGGMIEPGTKEQAEAFRRVAGGAAWGCAGAGPEAFRRWHVRSSELAPESFPSLARLMAQRYEVAVAFHGFSEEEIRIGGIAPPKLLRRVAATLRAATRGEIEVRIAGASDRANGLDPANVVNRVARGGAGIQLEQSRRARRDHGESIARSVAELVRELRERSALSERDAEDP
jgi:phage replication-related protein YjqB (UPF0714/DUF867 family)